MQDRSESLCSHLVDWDTIDSYEQTSEGLLISRLDWFMNGSEQITMDQIFWETVSKIDTNSNYLL